ncbi:MAG: hypothetical protein AB7I42_27650 [Bradyrhizobium sp.]|uniref:hypothetical protein n=1 Tax=Bradyrhizobium sp. TaxID=376 RepID=UPI003D0FEAE1
MKKKRASKIAKPSLFVVFGVDENGRARGARFPTRQFELALEAATLPGMAVYEAVSTEMQLLAKQLPSGRAYASRRAPLPFIEKDLYDRLHAASGGLVRDRNGEAS